MMNVEVRFLPFDPSTMLRAGFLSLRSSANSRLKVLFALNNSTMDYHCPLGVGDKFREDDDIALSRV